MHPGFRDQEIVLGVTGSIAAYKACELASRLKEAGAKVLPVLTRGGAEFVGAAALEGVTGRPVIRHMFDPAQNPEIEHIAVARRAALFLIAPASANILAKAAHGIADDWLTTTLLATRAPVLFAPAMNTQMYLHPATQANIALLQSRGARFVGPGEGNLACGEVGPGRLIDTPAILEAALCALSTDRSLAGRRVLITSGANHEPIDPVRFIGNRSSGKMGRAIVLEALRRGAEVTVVTGPHEAPLPHAAQVVRVDTAAQMHEAVEARFDACDIFIAAAAVADYRVESPETDKRKRQDSVYTLTLVPNADIAAAMGVRKRPGQIAVGFAAETRDFVAHAQDKLARKKLDLICANEVGTTDSGFGTDTHRAWLLTPGAEPLECGLIGKDDLAARIFDAIAPRLSAAGDAPAQTRLA
ncbi:MAG: bifunctional phosphopantothenoylcysteine decarboxylase/phosphopantothenate--cysteine ligase CoaBC [Candidatus Hydrogenedens sp.]|nr:bifunctional phosphopantothenoylcysteine decarboxylase/phosphopantothenate--cysteine ligase CoaBC [Candidatus Hydrogenedens sp.]